MKSKKKQRLLALILSMVLMLSASISAMAEGEVPAEASGTETTENQAAAQSLGEEAVPETEVTTEENGIAAQAAELTEEPVQEETEQEITEVPAENTETPAETTEPVQEETGEPAETTETDQTIVQSTEAQEDSAVAEETPVEEQPAETTEETVTEETVVSEAAELKQEFTDKNGNVTQTVTAYVPEGAFQATADQISMEVSLLNTDDTNYIKGMMEELLPENHYLDGYVLYQIDFKVNDEITQPAKAVTITMNGNDLAVEDTQKAHVFYYDSEDPEVEGDKDQLIEVTQKDQLIKSLEEAGQSTENIEDYNYSEIAVNDGNADTITVKGWNSTIYGCYVEKEAVTELTYEDDSVTVTVSADEAGIIPEGAELSVTPITKTEITDDMSEEEKAQAEEINAQYDFTEKQLQKDSEKNDTTMEGFLAYDICFLVDGEEVEPSGDVKVVMDFKEAAVPEGVSEDAEVTVKHLKEDESAEDGVVVEDMTEAASVETTENVAVQKVELTAESFSVYTISWTYNEETSSDWRFKINVVDTSGNSIGSGGKVTYPGSSAAVEDIVAVLGLDLQEWKFEYATTGRYTNDDRITAFRLSSGNTQYRLEEETGYPHTADRNTEFYFVFSNRPAIETIKTTEDTISKGITINLFDYQVGPDGDESTEGSGLNQGINDVSNVFKFVSDRKDDNGDYNKGGGINRIIQPLLKDGYPVLKNNESLGYLFNGTSTKYVKEAYLDLNNLFVLDGAGYYSYDSTVNHAYLDKNSNTFKVYNQPGSGFFPFTTQDHMFDAKAVQDNAVIGGDGMNHYFGMTVESTFIQPNNGRITYANEDSNETTEDMVFEFRGDDDVWVFIDGVLVMDLGGIHSPIEGSINFATGIVTEDGQQTSIHQRFSDAGVKNLNDIFESNGNGGYRFTDYSDHEIKFFYLERGNDQANCKIRFNLQTIPNDSLLVTKEVTDEDNNDLDYVEDIDFMFQILKDGKEWSNATYDLYEGNVLITENKSADSHGYFTLKHGQSALFKFDPDSDQTFEIKEEGAYLNGYEVTCNGGDITLTPVEGTETTLPSESTGVQNISDISSVLFQNEITETATLSIEKVMEDTQAATEGLSFAMNVKIGGELYEGTYKINDVEHETDPQKPGVIVLEPGQTATITGLPYGTRFEVWEGTTTGYSPTYLINGECYNPSLPEFDEETGESNGVYTASASISGDSIVTVKNSKNPFAEGSTDVNVKKEWENQSSYDLPEWVKVTLYEDTNKDGKYSEGDTIVSGKEVLELNAENSWSDGWENLPGDIDYVV